MRSVNLVTWVFVLFASYATFANCDARNEIGTYFSDPLNTDKFSITISGPNCTDLVQIIRIHNAKNELLYEHTSEFIDGTREQISQEFIEFIVQFTLHENFFDLSSNLPAWGKLKNHEGGKSLQQVLVSHDEYSELKKQNWPMFSHQSSQSDFLTLTYDQSKKEIVKIMNVD